MGKFNGSIAKVAATDLGAQLIKALLARSGVQAEQISEVILGQVLTAGVGQNPGRQALIRAGLPDRIPGISSRSMRASGPVSLQCMKFDSAGYALRFRTRYRQLVRRTPSRTERASQQGTQTSTYANAPALDPTYFSTPPRTASAKQAKSHGPCEAIGWTCRWYAITKSRMNRLASGPSESLNS